MPRSAPWSSAPPPPPPAPAEPPRPKATRAAAGKRPARARWFVVERGHDDGLNEPVAVLAKRRSEQAASNEATRWRRCESARNPGGNGALYEVLTADQITSRRDWATATRRGVLRKGPPPEALTRPAT